MRFEVEFENSYSADGVYRVEAEGFDSAALYWADSYSELTGWTAFGYVKIDSVTNVGEFDFYGGRAVPKEATHILVRAFRADLAEGCDELFPIERERIERRGEELLRCVVLTDLHLTRKAGTVRFALRAAAGADCIILPGDITNDGSEDEFKLFEGCLDDAACGVLVYCVNGNHDLMSGEEQYAEFQRRRGAWQSEFENICCGEMNGIEIIGVNAGEMWTNDVMRVRREQLEYLNSLLDRRKDAWRVVICHTPLSRNMPVRNGHLSTYLNRDAQMQKIIDAHENVIFLSGHTHLSPNLNSGVVSFDRERNNIYVNCGSIRPTEMGKEAAFSLPEWKEGNVAEIVITENAAEICMCTIHTGKRIARGYYKCAGGERVKKF